jgi:hypothetical protein
MEKERIQLEKNTRTIQQRSAGSANIVDNRQHFLSGTSLQRVEDDEEDVAQGKMEHTAQRVEGEEDDEVLQGKMGDAAPKNETGLPDNLKAGVESLSGFSLDNVRVHYNSSKPATVQALAYTQGTDIHVAPGQEKHLPHEAWHVAQQMAGRVSPTTNINGMPVNDNAALEHEADVMGEKAVTQRRAKGEYKKKEGEKRQTDYYACENAFYDAVPGEDKSHPVHRKSYIPWAKDWSFDTIRANYLKACSRFLTKDEYKKKEKTSSDAVAQLVPIIVNNIEPPAAYATLVNFVKDNCENDCDGYAEQCVDHIMVHTLTSGGGTGMDIGGQHIFHISHGFEGKGCTVFFIHTGPTTKRIVGVGHHFGRGKASYKLDWVDGIWTGVRAGRSFSLK